MNKTDIVEIMSKGTTKFINGHEVSVTEFSNLGNMDNSHLKLVNIKAMELNPTKNFGKSI